MKTMMQRLDRAADTVGGRILLAGLGLFLVWLVVIALGWGVVALVRSWF